MASQSSGAVLEGKSELVSDQYFSGDAALVEILLLTAVLCVFIYLFCIMIGAMVRGVMELGGGYQALKDKANRCRQQLAQFAGRLESLDSEVKQQSQRLKQLVEQRRALRLDLEDLNTAPEVLVREVGLPDLGCTALSAMISNRAVRARVVRGQAHPQLDASWRLPQEVVVWARSVPEARMLLAKHYPETAGFVLESLKVRYQPPPRISAPAGGPPHPPLEPV